MTYGNGQGEPEGKEPVDWVVDLFVHTPIGLAVMAWKRVPEFVSAVPDLVGQALSKGCAQLAEAEERISEEVRKARMIGQVAVTFGGRQLRREVDARLRDAREAAGGMASFLPGAGGAPNGAEAVGATTVSASATPTAPASPPDAAAKPSATKATAIKAKPSTATKAVAAKPSTAAKSSTAAKPAAARKPAAKTVGTRKTTKAPSAKKASGATKPAGGRAAPASAGDLPIREYDGLSASQVVSRLSGLSPDELRAVRTYEEGSRGRRTVLQAIDRLLD